MLHWRIIFGVSISATIIAICVADSIANFGIPGLWVTPLVFALAWLAIDEILALQEGAGVKTTAWPVFLGVTLMVVSAATPVLAGIFSIAPSNLPPPQTLDMSALAIGFCAVLLAEMIKYEKPDGVVTRLAGGVFAMVYVGVSASFILRLRLVGGLGDPETANVIGVLAFLSLCVTVKLSDVGAYTVGHMMGRHKLVPKLSPGKTIEGAIGGLVFGCFGAWFTCNIIGGMVLGEAANPAPWWSWLLFGIVVTIAGVIGDLAESLLKRNAGRKDSSHWLRGLGGVLDILDSLLLAAPVAYCFWAFGWIRA